MRLNLFERFAIVRGYQAAAAAARTAEARRQCNTAAFEEELDLGLHDPVDGDFEDYVPEPDPPEAVEAIERMRREREAGE